MKDERPDLILAALDRRDGSTHRIQFLLTAFCQNISSEEYWSKPFNEKPEEYFRSFFRRVRQRDVPDQEEAMYRFGGQGARLFRELFPEKLQDDLWALKDKVSSLVIQSNIPMIPWEFCKFAGRDETGPFFCEQFAMSQWLPGRQGPERLSANQMAIVFPEHEAIKSREEETDLTKLFGPTKISATYKEMRNAMSSGNFDAWHFGGEHNESGGFELNEGKGFWPDDLSEIHFRSSPLIFLNACQTGQMNYDLTGLGGWAAGFMNAGAGAYIGTHFGVHGQDAYQFSMIFYEEMLHGATIAEATRTARQEIKDMGSPSWLAYTVYANPIARLNVSPKSKDDRTQPTSPEVLRQIRDQGAYLMEKSHEFVGRKELFSMVETFTHDRRRDRGALVLACDPGFGKSAFASRLVRKNNWLHHFNISREGITKKEFFLRNLCAQLIARFDLPYISLPRDVEKDPLVLAGLLDEVSRKTGGERIVIVVDGLDETDADEFSQDGNTLGLPDNLPKGIYFVITTRPDWEQLTIQMDGLRLEEIEASEPWNLDDIRSYILIKSQQPQLAAYLERHNLTNDLFLDTLVERSEGNFMYLKYTLPQLVATPDKPLAYLPRGLKGYYEDHWKRMRMEDEEAWFAYKLEILMILYSMPEPVSLEFLVEHMQVANRARTEQLLREWGPFLHHQKTNGVSRYKFYHKSFDDFLSRKKDDVNEHIDMYAIETRIADALWRL